MAEQDEDLGKLLAVHAIAPEYMQRAVFVAVLSFLFFLGMMITYYVRQSVGYFLLASAFLLIYVITLFAWNRQRRSLVKIYERGISYKNQFAIWSDIESVNDDEAVRLRNGDRIVIPKTIVNRSELLDIVRERAKAA